ncbi:MAG: glycerate kinase [Chthoniobacterales bacterium]|nr:glycerate kinase [Chthoniobacterales bacterium]
MRILVAPDKFKGSLGAEDVGAHIAAGLRAARPRAEIKIQPIADGGEGTAEVIRRAGQGEWLGCSAHDSLGREISTRYAWLSGSQTAVMEMSAAAGLAQISPNERDPLRASTFGVGEMLRAAAGGARHIILGLGGSATNDGGCGLARALGFRFFDDGDREIIWASELENLARIAWPNEVALPPITGATDVRNPLLGSHGASRIFGPQKGASLEAIEILERGLTRLADVIATSARDLREIPGAGAAGGLGFGLLAFCDAEIRSGFEVVAEAIDLRRQIAKADYVITGEGSLDRQTLEGKGPAGIARLARALGKPVFAIAGRFDGDEEVRALFDGIVVLDDAPPFFARTAALLEARARELASSFHA